MKTEKEGVGFEVGFKKKNRLFRTVGNRLVLFFVGVVILLLLVLAVTRIPGRFRRPESDRAIIALVNGQAITAADFERHVAGLPDYYRAYATANRSQFLQDLVDRELIYQHARHSSYARSEEFRARVRDFEKEILVQDFVRREILENVDFSERELRDYYEENHADFVSPEGVHLSVILVADESRAKNLLARISSGDDFHDLSREFSVHPSRLQGGNLGLIRRGDLSPEIENIAFALQPGNYSRPVETETGYYILHVSAYVPERKMTFEEAVPEIRRRRSGVRGEEDFHLYVRELRNASRIEVNNEKLEKMVF